MPNPAEWTLNRKNLAIGCGCILVTALFLFLNFRDVSGPLGGKLYGWPVAVTAVFSEMPAPGYSGVRLAINLVAFLAINSSVGYFIHCCFRPNNARRVFYSGLAMILVFMSCHSYLWSLSFATGICCCVGWPFPFLVGGRPEYDYNGLNYFSLHPFFPGAMANVAIALVIARVLRHFYVSRHPDAATGQEPTP